MTKQRQAQQTQPKIPTLIPVEYCSPDRAARLLGCEVDDLFHWAAIGAIKLYAIFDCFEVTFVNEDSSGGMLNISVNPWLNKDYTHVSSSGKTKVFGYGPSYLNHSAELRIFSQSNFLGYEYIEISGLWEISQSGISKVDYRHSIENELSWSISASSIEGCEQGHDRGIEICDVAIEDIESRIRIVRSDLIRLNEHIATGKEMSIAPNLFGGRRNDITENDSTGLEPNKTRSTRAQASAIVELLVSLGYTMRDLSGSAEALQIKISNNSHSKTLSTITPKTLRSWLALGGGRK
ncbi:hypothetical protein [Aeromonas veronii]|uniref:hypothetical protein n=1 Tax=Aeromonas veronii TaxID=654 RepID=UPI0011AFBD83|nr:hypothetical protein [Aeromonas veronii]